MALYHFSYMAVWDTIVEADNVTDAIELAEAKAPSCIELEGEPYVTNKDTGKNGYYSVLEEYEENKEN